MVLGRALSVYARGMASINVPVSDEKILALLQAEHGLAVGKGELEALEVQTNPPASNSIMSHEVSVTLKFYLRLGEVETLIGF